MINKPILFFSIIALFSPMAQAVGEEQPIQSTKSLITPQQIDQLIQKFQPSMKPGQRIAISNMVQEQLNNLSPLELAQLANAKLIDLPDLVTKHISQMSPGELSQIKQTLKLQKSPQQ